MTSEYYGKFVPHWTFSQKSDRWMFSVVVASTRAAGTNGEFDCYDEGKQYYCMGEVGCGRMNTSLIVAKTLAPSSTEK